MRNMGNTICFATSYNSPPKRPHDGDEFMREMTKFSKWVNAKIQACAALKKPIDVSLRQQFHDWFEGNFNFGITAERPLIETFAFFMHGSWRELYGINYNIWSTQVIADLISWHNKKDPNIVLYACGCGGSKGKWKRIHEYKLESHWDMRGEFGFAMRLANDLSEIGIHDYRIFAHVGRGHVTKRPYCVWITEENDIIKRRKIVPYRSWASLNRKGRRQWLRWVKFIQKTQDGRFRAPFLTNEELAEIIGE